MIIKHHRFVPKINSTTLIWYLKKITGRLYQKNVKKEHRELFETLNDGDLVLDIGANIGVYSFAAAVNGADVHAFEPHPEAFKELKKALGNWSNVTLHNVAVSTSDGVVSLYLHEKSNQDPVKYSTGASILIEKENVSDDQSVEVNAIDLAEFVLKQTASIKLLKMDIEGAEVSVIPKLLEMGAMDRVENILVELHDEKNPKLSAPTNALRELLRDCKKTRVYLDWH